MSADLVARLRWVAGDTYENVENMMDPYMQGLIHGLIDRIREAADYIEALEDEGDMSASVAKMQIDALQMACTVLREQRDRAVADPRSLLSDELLADIRRCSTWAHRAGFPLSAGRVLAWLDAPAQVTP